MTIVRAVALDVASGVLPGVPSAHVIRFSPEGRVSIEGPVSAGGRNVQRAGHLLETLLPGFDAPPELRVPGALRLVVARALGTLDLPPYPSLESFAEALSRFAAGESHAVVADLVKSWSASVNSQLPTPTAQAQGSVDVSTSPWEPDLTISDIRRARRATRLTLADISSRTRIPVGQLRELEWGYFRHWPTGHYGRTQLVRYARASGLDDQVVVRTVWPMIQEHARTDPETALVPVQVTDLQPLALESVALVRVAPAPPSAPAPRKRRLAALAIPALIAIGLVPAFWGERSTNTTQTAQTDQSTQTTEPGRTVQPTETARNEEAVQTEPAARTAPTAATPPGSENPPARTRAQDTRAAAANAGPTVPQPGRAAVATTGMGEARPAITMPDEDAYSPSFASEGSAMFYHSGGALMRADTDGGGAVLRVTRVVDDRSRNFHARPSPDGSRIAFDSDREGERAVYVADASGKGVQRVSGEGFAAIPSWSPDGRTLAFVRAEPESPRVWNLWTADLETGQLHRLTSHRVGQPWGGSWFPDGTRMAYSHETRLVVRDLASGRERVYPSPIKGRLVRTPAVSPDGRRIIFQVHRDGAWLLDLTDGSMRRVLADPGAEEYTWSPDGRRVAYHSRRSGEWGVWIMAAR